jgi:predicted enzyme related to lactoylglutathione lyase
MTTRDSAPLGSPCWTDLWTSDVAGSGRFYSELFGWEAQEPSEEFGGYFMFTRDGVPVAGGMGDMGEMKADNTWKIYLSTDDITKTVAAAEAASGHVIVPVMEVADLGIQAVLQDPTGALIGAWQPGTFPGFTVLEVHGTPSWSELLTREFSTSVDFYRSVFRWETKVEGDSDEFRYSTMRNPDAEGELAGVMDASAWLPPGQPSSWSMYWHTDDIHATIGALKKLGGTVVHDAEETPYGTLATVADPAGAVFKLRTPPK